MSKENENVVFLNPDHDTMRALGLHNQSSIVVDPNWSGHSAPSILADLRAFCESIRHPPPGPRRLMVRTSGGFLQVIPAGDGVHALQYGFWIGKFCFYEWSRQPHSRVLRHWHDERCER